ncbi:MAG: hypothetical protein HPY55_09740 [Firmicutes bacterium]|nr:hypothetical protein [Bacillota bacterium]
MRLSVVAAGCIGIPRGLLYYEYFPLWSEFFKRLGFRVTAANNTTRRILDAGVTCAVDEACLPVKAYLGHCIETASGCDLLFVPRVVSVERGAYTCPKLLGLPDMVNAMNLGVRVLTAVVDVTRRGHGAFVAAMSLAGELGVGRVAALRAYLAALLEYARFRHRLNGTGGWFDNTAGARPVGPGALPRVLVLGHSYVVNDPGLNLGLRQHIERLGASPFTVDSLPWRAVNGHLRGLSKPIFWTYQKKMYGGAMYHIRNHTCDGIIQVASFGCGPDSLIAELIRREADRKRVPYMALTVDEHTGEAGTVTRVEAFLDMLTRRVSDRVREEATEH